jgi:hypothetical protein
MRHVPVIHRPAGIRSGGLGRLAVTLACLSVVGLSLSATAALAEDCPNAALRAENNSTRLPECRAYEMVTPLYKEGFPPDPNAGFTDNGVVTYRSLGSFAGNAQGSLNLYDATRSAAGWTTTALSPPALLYDTGGTPGGGGRDGVSFWDMKRRDVPEEKFGFWRRSPDGVFTRIGDAVGEAGEVRVVVGTSADGSTKVFNPGPQGGAISEYVGTGNGPSAPIVSVDNDEQPTGPPCGAPVSVSADGRVIVFTANCGGGGGVPQVWARVAGSVSVEASASECTRTSGDPGGACNSPAAANFEAAAPDGSRVFFTTTQQLVNGDTDQGNDLYECDIPPGAPSPVGVANPCSSLSEVSGAASGANVENVVNVSEDGTRVYFVAHGVLAANLGSNDAPAVAGDNNLYVSEKDAAHPARETTFVAKLETNDISKAQATANGRYLIFNTANRLLASDTDEANDVYRYDADTGGLLRLSFATSGTGGNEPGAQTILPPSASAMTDDASTVIFETSEALSPSDTDGVRDVYEWHEGQVSLISNGGASAFGTIGITPSGRDIYFLTARALTAGDSGAEPDIYDARVGGGFPASVPTPCFAEACQGAPASQPQPPGISASAAFNGPGSQLAPESPPANLRKPKPPTAAQKLAKALKACKAKHNKKKRKACEKKARKTYRRAK